MDQTGTMTIKHHISNKLFMTPIYSKCTFRHLKLETEGCTHAILTSHDYLICLVASDIATTIK